MFKVPERARITDHPVMGSDETFGNNGAFVVESPEHGWRLLIIASDSTYSPEAEGWEHCSVHAVRDHGKREQLRTPTWREMAFVKDLFWDEEAVVMQLHPKRSEYVNTHPHTLHLWRHESIPTPPKMLV
jgi:hypothetical protein